MSNFQQNLEKYASLAVEVGVNVQKGSDPGHQHFHRFGRICPLSGKESL